MTLAKSCSFTPCKKEKKKKRHMFVRGFVMAGGRWGALTILRNLANQLKLNFLKHPSVRLDLRLGSSDQHIKLSEK